MQAINQEKTSRKRKVNKGLTLLGGLLGLMVGTAGLYFFAISGEYHSRLVLFSFLPLAAIMWFSTFDKGAKGNDDNGDVWNFGKEEKVSKFNRPEPNIDLFGIILSIVFAYLTIYLSEVLALTHNILKEYPGDSFFATFTDVFLNILKVDWASEYIWKYWLGLTIMLVIVAIVAIIAFLIDKKKNHAPGRKLREEEQAKLAYGAVLFARNGLSYDYLLGYDPRGRLVAKDAKAMLTRDWAINNKDDVVQTVNSLLVSPHNNDLDQILHNIRSGQASENEKAIYADIADNLMRHYNYSEDDLNRINTLNAWNYDRLVNLVRFAYAAKYLSEEEMWNFIDQTILEAKSNYQNWRDYFAAILLGRSLSWGGDFSNNRMVAMKLLENPNSVYNRYPFK